MHAYLSNKGHQTRYTCAFRTGAIDQARQVPDHALFRSYATIKNLNFQVIMINIFQFIITVNLFIYFTFVKFLAMPTSNRMSSRRRTVSRDLYHIYFHASIKIIKLKFKTEVSRDQSTKSKETRNKILAQENTKV